MKEIQVHYTVKPDSIKKPDRYLGGSVGEYAFPDDELAFVESPFAGMEHQGAIVVFTIISTEIKYINNLDVNIETHQWKKL